MNRVLPSARNVRACSQAIKVPQEALSSSYQRATPTSAPATRYPYFVRRNSRGSLPIYTDIRNGGTRYLVQIRNVEGRVNDLAVELKQSLFKTGSPEATRLTVKINDQRHITLTGGHFKRDVMAWFTEKGF
ncbi:mitochondrial large subunit ribosomal protein-domain-containing protein [Melanogaster broomeanus]|nr:mitochondrial large subunit ribosomal protein-domain-containing protein [Melanogaster broomeanus]